MAISFARREPKKGKNSSLKSFFFFFFAFCKQQNSRSRRRIIAYSNRAANRAAPEPLPVVVVVLFFSVTIGSWSRRRLADTRLNRSLCLFQFSICYCFSQSITHCICVFRSRKRVFVGSSSSVMDPEVVEIKLPALISQSSDSKKLKQKEV